MLANKAIESADPTQLAKAEEEPDDVEEKGIFKVRVLSSDKVEIKFIFKKITKSFKNISWYKSVTDLNGTMIAPKARDDSSIVNKREQ